MEPKLPEVSAAEQWVVVAAAWAITAAARGATESSLRSCHQWPVRTQSSCQLSVELTCPQSVCAQCCAGVGGTHTQSETLRKTSKKWHHARNEHWDPAPSSRVHWAQRERYASVFISQPVDSVKFLVVMWNKHGGIFVIFSGILLLSETDFYSQSRSGAWVRQHSTDNLRRPNNCFDKKSKTENFLYQKSYWKQVGLFLHYASLEWYQALSLRC